MSKKRIFSLAMAAMMLFSATAYGANVNGTDPSDLEKNTDGKFDVTYTDAADGKEYMIWALKGRETDVSNVSFSQDNVLYINQSTASGSSVTFDAFLPMKMVDSTVLISGQGMDAPIIVGYIKGEGNNISGSIGLTGRTENLGGAVVTLTSTEDESVTYTATTEADGTFVLESVADGTYKLTVKKESYLSYTDKTFEVSSETTWSEDIKLIPGDLIEDDEVTIKDYVYFKSQYKLEGDNLASDFNGDGEVTIKDYVLFKTYYRATATEIE